MKYWRKYHKALSNIFQADKVHYGLESGDFMIWSKQFVMEELYDLSCFCRDNRLWFYIDKNRDGCVLVVNKI